MKRFFKGDLDIAFYVVMQIAAGALLIFFVMVGGALVFDAADRSVPGTAISANAQNLILTLTGGVLSLLSTIMGRHMQRRRLRYDD